MKKIIYSIIFGVTLFSCSKDVKITETITVQPVQRTVLVYKGATWCGPCGSSGKPVLRAMEVYGDDKIICLSSQTNDGLNSPAGDTIGDRLMKRFNQNGIPHLFMGVNTDFKNFYPNQSTANNYLTQNNALSPIAGCYVDAVVKPVNGSSVNFQIEVKSKVQYFKDGFGSHTFSILVLEDSIIKGQSGSSNPLHNNVVRGYGGSKILGETITTITTNSTQDFSYVIPISNSWKKENLKVVGVIWSWNGNNFNPVNATAVKVK
jgi:hypothetical protein